MGTVISKAANGLGGALGNAFVAPIKTIFGRSCEGVCSGTWDIICFIEHLCISSLVRLLMVMGLTCITLFFFYLLFKVGIIQCIGRSLCKMAWAACVSYWSALEGISCFLWHKLKNTKRVYRHRHHHSYDIEEGDSSSSEDSDGTLEDYHRRLRVIKRSRSVRERRKSQMRRSLYPTRQRLKSGRYRHGGSHHHVRLKTAEVSVHVKGSSKGFWNSRQLQLMKKPAFHRSRQLLFKKQRFR